MPIHIDRLTADVTPEPEPAAGAEERSVSNPWDEVERVRQSHARLLRDGMRTSAEGLDD